jgi:hypothetical protein
LSLVDAFRTHYPTASRSPEGTIAAPASRRTAACASTVLLTRPLAETLKDVVIDREERKGKGASDHAPVLALLK